MIVPSELKTKLLSNWYRSGVAERENKEIEILFWDGTSYDISYRRLKIVGPVEAVCSIIDKLPIPYQDADFRFITKTR